MRGIHISQFYTYKDEYIIRVALSSRGTIARCPILPSLADRS